MRFLLVDRIVELTRGERARAVKNVAMSEDVFAHHFPERPIMPGTMILESLVQLADLMVREHSAFRQACVVTEVARLKLRRFVTPGDQLILEVRVLERAGDRITFSGQATVEGGPVTTCEFTVELVSIESEQDGAEAQRLFGQVWRQR